MYIAGSGGHLTQLDMLSKRFEPSGSPDLWVSDRTAQSESLLQDRPHLFVDHSAPRDVLQVVKNIRPISRAIVAGEHQITAIVSTGAGIALSAVAASYLHQIPFVYIESATRYAGLSLTGRVMTWLPGITRLVQYRNLVSRRWAFRGSVFDQFTAAITTHDRLPDNLYVFLTLGANQHIGFRALVERVSQISQPDWIVFCQTGPTDMTDIPFPYRTSLNTSEMLHELGRADVIIAHAGTGSALSALAVGKVPLLIPRSGSGHEHVDEHQVELARMLVERGVAVAASPNGLSISHIEQAY